MIDLDHYAYDAAETAFIAIPLEHRTLKTAEDTINTYFAEYNDETKKFFLARLTHRNTFTIK